MGENSDQMSFEIIVLMYHRIDNTSTDPWGICVSPKNFEEQVQFLKNNYNVISVDDAVEQLSIGNINDKTICITFDDGYADNYIHARSILEKYNCPATFFIATAFIDQPKPFWWDELEIILLHSKKLPHQLVLNIQDEIYKYTFDANDLSEEDWQKHIKWKWHQTFPTQRCKVFTDIWQKLQPLRFNKIEKQIKYIRNWAGINHDNYPRLPMSTQQLQNLCKNKLFTVAMHTHTHPDLEKTSAYLQAEDILTCKKILGYKFGVDSRLLAYPYGRYNNFTIDTVTALQLAASFTTQAGGINKHSNPAMLGRFQVMDWDINIFKNHLENWKTKTEL